jgi:aerobic-type carbon monoxide dehydrogenase small subunit (CoxS/CutS family)
MATRSCTLTVGEAEGSEILTIEGLASSGKLHPIQQAFVDHDALQCGYCTPGMIMNAYGLLMDNPEPSREEIITGMGDNYCRCGAHIRIIKAIQSAGKMMKKATTP